MADPYYNAKQGSKALGGMAGKAAEALKGRKAKLDDAEGDGRPAKPASMAPAERGGDPTRKVTQAEWERMKAEQQAAAQKKYEASKALRRK